MSQSDIPAMATPHLAVWKLIILKLLGGNLIRAHQVRLQWCGGASVKKMLYACHFTGIIKISSNQRRV
jgi:hypothetical protein